MLHSRKKERKQHIARLGFCLGVMLLVALATVLAHAAEGEAALPCAKTGCGGSYQNGFCTVCGDYQEPTLNDNGTTDDTTDDYYEIGNAGQLYWFAKYINGQNAGNMGHGCSSGNAVLTQNITVNHEVLKNAASGTFRPWTPIGSNTSVQYIGSFDGKGYTISGLWENDQENQCVGLFGYLTTGATVQNVTVADSCFDVTYRSNAYVGGLAGYAVAENGGVTLQNCSFSGKIRACDESNRSYYAGGLVGYAHVMNADTFTIKNCCATAEVTASSGSSDYAGGLVGSAQLGSSSAQLAITSCCATGKVTVTATNAYAGGLVGQVTGAEGTLCVANCYATGDVTATATQCDAFAGGLGGRWAVGNAAVTSCYATGKIAAGSADTTGWGDVFQGGIVGKSAGGTLTDCYYLDTAASQGVGNEASATGAMAMTDAQFKSGEVAYLLNGDQTTIVWYQTLYGSGKMATPGFSGQTVIYDATAEAYDNLPFVSVAITWTSLAFTYTDGLWDPATHSYGVGTWASTGGTVTVANEGNAAVTVNFTYSTTRAEVSGSFDKATLSLAPNTDATAKLALAGKPENELTSASLGRITVGIAKQAQSEKAGWQIEKGATYYYKNGAKATGLQEIDGACYYFDRNGVMQTGWVTDVPGWEGKWFYFDPTNGVMQTGWLQLEGSWYYFHADGHMAANETIDGDRWVGADGKYVG